MRGGQSAYGAVDVDVDLAERGQGQHQRRSHLLELAPYQIGRGRVAQRQPYHRVESRTLSLRAAREPWPGFRQLEGQPEDGYVACSLGDLGRQFGDSGHQVAGAGRRPHHTAGRAVGQGGDGRLVRHGDHGGEADPEPADGVLAALCRGAQRRQRLDPGRVQRGSSVRGGQYPVAQPQQQPPRKAGSGRGVGGVLGEFDDDPVAVAAEREVLLGVRVLPEPRRGGRPCGENPVTQARRPVWIYHVTPRPAQLWPSASSSSAPPGLVLS
jgi:hypothetical protein